MSTDHTTLLARLHEALPKVGESEDVWCSVQGHDLRAAIAALAQPAVSEPRAWEGDGTFISNSVKRTSTPVFAARYPTPLYAHPAQPAVPEPMTREFCAAFPGTAAGIINKLARQIDAAQEKP